MKDFYVFFFIKPDVSRDGTANYRYFIKWNAGFKRFL